MQSIPKISTGWARGGIAVLLALVLALRVMALPMVMAGNAPGPGMMAICTGSDIIYIPIGSDSPADPGEGTPHDPCPAFGITAALDLPDLGVPAPTGRLVALAPQVGNPSHATRPTFAAHRPRAPPVV
jgi:hypothetical protein